MNIPDKIYLQWFGSDDDVTWNSERINDDDIEYVRSPRWIPISEPPTSKPWSVEYLVLENGVQDVAQWIGGGEFFTAEDGITENVTHWMPLPDPPDVEE